MKHIDKKEDRLYRIFFYDCPPLTKNIHHPITGNPIKLSESKTALLRNDLHSQLRKTRNLALRLGFLDERNARWKIKDPKKERKFIAQKLSEKLTEADVVYHAPQKVLI